MSLDFLSIKLFLFKTANSGKASIILTTSPALIPYNFFRVENIPEKWLGYSAKTGVSRQILINYCEVKLYFLKIAIISFILIG
jgi:hypothetical protein